MFLAHALGQDARGEAAAPVRVRDLHADDVGLGDVRMAAEDVGDFVGRYVFGFPAEGVAEAVDEVDGAVGELALHVAGEEPRVAFGEEVGDPAF